MHTLIHDILQARDFGGTYTARGWVRTRRDSKGGFSFIELYDGSDFDTLQVIADGDLANYEADVLALHTGAAISVTGELRESPGKGQAVELRATELVVYGHADPETYPLQKKRISFERLREIAHLRARTNTFGAVARVRNCLAHATHRFFQERRFLYLNSPIITTSDCEGAGQMFHVTTLDMDKPPRRDDGSVDYDQDFFGRQASLTVSGQLEGETYATALGRIYTFGPTFRAENSNTSRHLSEFWMVEPEVAFHDLTDNARLAEDYLKFCLRAALEECPRDMAFFDQWVDKGIVDRLAGIVESQFVHLPYTEAIAVLEKAKTTFEFPVSWGIDLQSEHERYLTEEAFKAPVVVTDFPKDIKAFYMRCNDDGRTVAAMDVLLPQVGEIIGGSQREDRLDILEARLTEMGLPVEDYWWYLDLRRFGSVPHAGFGLGFERLVQFVSGMQNIRDVIPYPRYPRHAEF